MGFFGIFEDAGCRWQFAIDAAIGCLEEAHFVDPGIGRHRTNQADVRTFGRFDGTNPAVVRMVDVADFEAGAVAAQTTRSKGRQTTLVGELGQRIGLVHEL